MAVRKLNVLGFASVQERAAAWLLQETDASDTVVLKTNREEQADYLCVARPVTIKNIDADAESRADRSRPEADSDSG